jgi:hypothetical protein
MYYKGTKEQCQEYNSVVVIAEKYDGLHTTAWANIIAHPNGKDFAIKAHLDYESSMSILSSLSSAWFPE